MSTAPQVSAGAILSGRWQVQDFIGSGDTGEVYGVRDMHGSATFALKLFWPSALGQADVWSAVQQTARTAAGLGAEGVARACDFGIDANSARPFFVSERMSWSSLTDRVRLLGPLAPAELATALAVLARALDAAHAAGVVHRDLKPENVFVSPDNANWVRISDFGVALLRSASPPPPGWGGSIGWVAPDAADPNARSTPAMDVFALGLVAFFALSGGALHRAARSTSIDPAALWQELTQPLDSASLRARELGASVDPAFDAWFQRAVAPMPQARFGSVAEMASAFAAIARSLAAPQSQNAVGLPGIAAAIAQPLVFQPDAHAPTPVQPFEVSAAPGYALRAEEAPSSAPPGVRTRSVTPVLVGGAVLCVALAALGIGALSHRRSSVAQEASAAALTGASASASASAAIAASTALANAAPAASAALSAALPAAHPQTSKALTAAKPVATSAAKPVASSAAKPVATAAKATSAAPLKAASAAPAKPSATPPKAVTKPVVVAPPKKKCGSVFIPCK